jgi:hypothetical protein
MEDEEKNIYSPFYVVDYPSGIQINAILRKKKIGD